MQISPGCHNPFNKFLCNEYRVSCVNCKQKEGKEKILNDLTMNAMPNSTIAETTTPSPNYEHSTPVVETSSTWFSVICIELAVLIVDENKKQGTDI